MRKSLLAALAVGLFSAGCSIDVNGAGVTVNEEKTFQVTGQPELTLRTADGSIEVRSWDRNEVRVEIRRRAASEDEAKALVVNATQEGNRIVIDAPARRERVVHIGNWVGESVSFIVTAPRQLTLDANSGDGSISVEDLSGTVALRSGDGSIRGGRIEGKVTANTGDGSIAISDVAGDIDLNTGDGSVRFNGKPGTLRVHSGDGSVNVEVADGSTMTADWSLTTGDGSITVTLPTAFNAEVQARSGDGGISVNGQSNRRGDDDSGDFKGRLGTGGRTINAHSGDGSIRISSR
jgi:nitrogen regulatory protein PII